MGSGVRGGVSWPRTVWQAAVAGSAPHGPRKGIGRYYRKNRGLKKQKDVQDVLDIGQTEVSHLMNARYHRFSEALLMAFLNKLDRKVTVQVSRRRKNEPLQKVVLA